MRRAVLASVLFALIESGLPAGGRTSAPSLPFGPAVAAAAEGGRIARVSVGSTGAEGNGDSRLADISADGRYVVFSSTASNLVPNDTNGVEDAFLHDRQTGATARVSVSSSGGQGNGASGAPAISGDGRWVTFQSAATNLVAGDTNARRDVFLHEVATGTTTRISVMRTGQQVASDSFAPAHLSADGRYAVFLTYADLLSGESTGLATSYRYDRLTGGIEGVCTAWGFVGRLCYYATISDDGRFVAFESTNSGLVAGDTNRVGDIFVRDMVTGVQVRASVSSGGAQTNNVSTGTAISGDGSVVAFASYATNLVPGDTNGAIDVFARDLRTGTTERISVGTGGTQADQDSWMRYFEAASHSLSRDGRYAVFQSTASNLVPGGAAGFWVYLHDRATRTTTLVSANSSGAPANGVSIWSSISADGFSAVFETRASNLISGDTNGKIDVFVADLAPAPGDEVPDEIGASFGAEPSVGVEIAEPVNTFTGNLSLSSVDLAIPGRGPPLRLVRSYNARDPRVGVLGPGWSSDLGWRVRERTSGDAVVFRPDGRRDVFLKQADATYAPPSGVFDVFTRRDGGGFSLRTVDQTLILFASDGLLTSIADRNGDSLAYTLDLDDRIVQIDAAGGRSLSFEYSTDGRLVRARDPAGRTVDYAYTDGRLSAVTDPTGAVTRYAYDGAGRLLTVTDPIGNVTLRNEYDGDGRVVAQTDAVGGVVRLAYDDTTRVTTHTDARGSVTRIAHDADGRTIRVTDPLGASVKYTYDVRGNRTSFRDRNGNTWLFSYDAGGNRTGVTDPVGGTATFTYDALNDLLSRTDPNGATWRYAYDARGNLTSVADPESAVTTTEVDASGLPTKVTDPDGVVTTYGYDASGHLTSIATAAAAVQNAYDAAGRLVRRTDANGQATVFAYDAADRLTSTTDALGQVTRLAYDAAGRPTRTTDRRGAATTFAYDAAGRMTSTADALGGTTAYAYDANGNRTAVTDPAGKTVRSAYDARDRLVAVTDAGGATARIAYDANGNVVETTDARGATARFAYDFRNLRTSATDRTAARTELVYDAGGRLVRTTDALGATTALGYDRAGRLVATTDALGGTSRVAYSRAGRRASVTDPKGNVTRFAYDDVGRLTVTTDALGGHVDRTYDAVGNVISLVDQLGRATRFEYDALDRLSSAVDALGGRTARTYDPEGALASLADANGGTTSYVYDLLGRLAQVTDALGGVTRYAYDARGLLTGLIDANGHSRGYAYDAVRRLVREADGLGRARTYSYDANGNRASTVDPKGQTATLAYDAEDRLVAVSYADGSAVTYTRDAAGQRTAMTDPLGTTTYAYDALRRPTRVTDPAGKTVRYAYDANSSRTSLTYPDGRTASYAYDALDRLVSVDLGGTTARYTYDAVGNALSGTFANGTRFTATYDALDRLTGLTNLDGGGKAASSFAYAYDRLGNVTSETATGAHDLSEARGYQYDALSRLVAVTERGGRTTRYAYDAVGNRTSALTNAGKDATLASFDAADQLVRLARRDGSVLGSFTYDANGNLVERRSADEITSFSWDAADRLIGVRTPDREVAYAYDGDGDLVRETRGGADAATLTYSLDLAGSLSQVLTASDGRDEVAFLYGLQRIAALGKDTRYYGADVRGSVRTTTDEHGKVSSAASYDAWGVARDQGDGAAKLASLFGFTGERQDARNGLIYLRARWYAPELGIFLSRDPARGRLTDPRTFASYAYALNDPTSMVDRRGLSATSLLDGATGYSYSGTAFYSDPKAAPTTPAEQPLGQRAAFAIAQTFADLDSPDLGTKAAAFAKVSLAGITVGAAATGAAALMAPGAVATAGSTLATAGWAIVSGAAALLQKGQTVFQKAPPPPPVAQKIAVIGENQKRVLAHASELSATTMPTVSGTHLERLAANRDWIQRLMDEGYTIVNIGRDASRVEAGREISPFFQAELEEIISRGYTSVIPGPWPIIR